MYSSVVRPVWQGMWIAATLAILAGCGPKPPPPPARVPVSVLKLQAHGVAIAEEYPAQIEASNTVEIRPRVGGVLERQVAVEGQHRFRPRFMRRAGGHAQQNHDHGGA